MLLQAQVQTGGFLQVHHSVRYLWCSFCQLHLWGRHTHEGQFLLLLCHPLCCLLPPKLCQLLSWRWVWLNQRSAPLKVLRFQVWFDLRARPINPLLLGQDSLLVVQIVAEKYIDLNDRCRQIYSKSRQNCSSYWVIIWFSRSYNLHEIFSHFYCYKYYVKYKLLLFLINLKTMLNLYREPLVP